ncbi:MAG: hypothetical protein ACYDA9_08330 [Terriglobia bacterium]
MNKIKEVARERNVFVDLASIGIITPDAVAGLLATIHHSKISPAAVWGNVPNEPKAREIINDSGFRNHVGGSGGYSNLTPKGEIRKRKSSQEVFQVRFDQVAASELIDFGTRKLYGTARPNGPSYSVLCEAMLNTYNHASKRSESREPWWASVYYDAERQRACFTFIDQGVGIFKSYGYMLRLKVWAESTILSRAQALERLFQGKIPSSTVQPGRGRGIPEMYVHCKSQRIRNLTVLTNNVIGYAETDRYEVLGNTFAGTLLYWEITI